MPEFDRMIKKINENRKFIDYLILTSGITLREGIRRPGSQTRFARYFTSGFRQSILQSGILYTRYQTNHNFIPWRIETDD
jgi:hypothetical protein